MTFPLSIAKMKLLHIGICENTTVYCTGYTAECPSLPRKHPPRSDAS